MSDELPLPVARLRATVPQRGRLESILVRPAQRAPVTALARVEAVAGAGLDGDHRRARIGRTGRSPRRQVTLVQAEHLPVVAALTGRETVDPALLRRNLVVAGVNLASLVDRRFLVGTVVLEGSGPCEPCGFMEEALGEGGYQAMVGHGGITARVLAGGTLSVGDPVTALPPDGDPRGVAP